MRENHPLARCYVALLNFSCELDLLFRRQERNPPDLFQVSFESGIAFIHNQNVFDGANALPLRKRGILRCHLRVGGGYLFGDRINSAQLRASASVMLITQTATCHTPMVRTTRKRTLPLCICS